jgi:hypothetical protein
VCGSISGGRVVNFPNLPGGETATITIRADVLCATANGSVLSSTVDVDTETQETRLDNNQLTLSATAVNPPPTMSSVSVSPAALGPPNHKLVPVTLSYSVSDNCGTPVCSLSVSSNEPINGTGDGDASPDWVIQDSKHVSLRAERRGGGGGRIYTLLVSCQDSAGGVTSKTATVTVAN